MRHFTAEEGPYSIPDRWEDEATRLLKIGWKGRLIMGLSQSAYRSYVFPVVSPAGVKVTTERSSSDHPWHQSVTIGSDRFYTYQQSPEGPVEQPPLNMYWDWPFQGRDAGRIISSVVDERTERAEDHLEITQRLQWQGPEEWGVGTYRRVLADEIRIIDVRPGDVANIIDVRSQVRPTDWDLRIGPCRHGYFTIRVADHLRVVDRNGEKVGGKLTASGDRVGEKEIRWQLADWVDYSGKDEQGRMAGVAMFQFPSVGNVPWYLVDYGSVRINPHRMSHRYIKRGEMLDLAIRVVAHDGNAEEAGIADLYAAFAEKFGSSTA